MRSVPDKSSDQRRRAYSYCTWCITNSKVYFSLYARTSRGGIPFPFPLLPCLF
ncbi:unnamed protein product [Rhodiola kirilowii]